MKSPALGGILTTAIRQAPGALGSALAADDGETVDSVASASDPFELALVTAHYAVIMKQVRSALGVFHYGAVSELVVTNQRLSILVRAVSEGYLAVLTLAPGAPLGPGQRALGLAAAELKADIA